ncbi:MAG TPA: hypothetical protein PLT35_13680, partial [Vicinamibacterales bacterium]|nr:hypothetical protein [Vicinamibacterales bacterium]
MDTAGGNSGSPALNAKGEPGGAALRRHLRAGVAELPARRRDDAVDSRRSPHMPRNMADVDRASRLPGEMGASTARLETA